MRPGHARKPTETDRSLQTPVRASSVYRKISKKKPSEAIDRSDKRQELSHDRSKMSFRASAGYLKEMYTRIKAGKFGSGLWISGWLNRDQVIARVSKLIRVRPCLLLSGPFHVVANELMNALKGKRWKNDDIERQLSSLLESWNKVKVANIPSRRKRHHLSNKAANGTWKRKKLNRSHPYNLTPVCLHNTTIQETERIWTQVSETLRNLPREGGTKRQEQSHTEKKKLL